MTVNFRNIASCLLLTACVLLVNKHCLSQVVNRNIPAFDSLKLLHTTGELNDSSYLKKAIDLIDNNISNPYLTDNTNYIQTVALKKPAYFEYRQSFFYRLSKNAIYNDREGSAFFYAEKMEVAAKQRKDYIPTLFSACLEIARQERWKHNAEGLAKSLLVLPFIETLPGLILKKEVPDKTLFYAQYILKYTQSMYLQLNDTLNAFRMQQLSKKIYDAISKRMGTVYTRSFQENIFSDYLFMEYQQSFHLNDQQAVQKILTRIYLEAVNAENKKYEWAYGKKIGACMFIANSFLETNQLDSAEKYLTIITGKSQFNYLNYDEQILKAYAALEKRKGNYKKAYEYIERSALLTDSLTTAQKMDIASNDYAQTEAEFNRAELDKASKEKVKRNWMIAALILLLTVVSMQFSYSSKRRNLRAKQNIMHLNFESQLQIARLEEQNRIAKQEERKRLGMDLHDSLAGTLAAIKIQLETAMLNNKELSAVKNLKDIYNNILIAYQNTRQKSHDWFDDNEDVNNILFSERIATLFDRVLPADKYQKQIWIDNESIKNLTVDEKIEYVYIINEAIANILKHSKATTVSLSLYEEVSHEIILLIKDDGIGFNLERAKRGIGLNSLNERVKKIGGQMNIISNKNGTEITITKPNTNVGS